MKISELWLREWVNPDLDGQELAALLTMAGLEVDAINPVAGDFTSVIVAKVLSTAPHPQADRLTLCEIDINGAQSLKVVCGATNVRAGLKVALAQVGAQLPGGLSIKESYLRGELSQGMLCSATELGLTDHSEGIIELDNEAPVGCDLRQYLTLNDQVLDIDLTPNRADCLSVLGIAREVAALTQLPLASFNSEHSQSTIKEQLVVQNLANTACPQYCGRIIRNINTLASTPLWMRERLRRAGIRTVSPVVDVTNYVMLELGQPMHAFDLNQINGDIIVRFAEHDEQLTLLDNQAITLHDKVLVIADQTKPLAIAGVMGGLDSAVNEQTKDIFLESAFFTPSALAGIARSYGLSTDSSQRYERGVDPALQIIALERATALLVAITGGDIGPLTVQTTQSLLPKAQTISFKPRRFKQLTGLELTEQRMEEILQALGMKVIINEDEWLVNSPTHRFDIHLEVDLIEEILRLHGYDNIPGEKMMTTLQAGMINPEEQLATGLAQFFIARGYHETISYSFVDPALQEVLYPEALTMTLLNPISSELASMRAGLWPGLLASMVYNVHRQQTAIKFFENGVVFNVVEGKLQEQACFAGLLMGDMGNTSWIEETRQFDFYDGKGDLQALFAYLKLPKITFIAAEHPALHPGKAARLQLEQQQVGWCGVLHPRISEVLGLHNEVILFELNLASLLLKLTPRYQQISKFPLIRRDLSLVVDKQINASEIEAIVRQTMDKAWLKAFEVFDVYTGDAIPADKKSLAISLTLQDDKRTLVDAEINEVISAIIRALGEKLAITLRN